MCVAFTHNDGEESILCFQTLHALTHSSWCTIPPCPRFSVDRSEWPLLFSSLPCQDKGLPTSQYVNRRQASTTICACQPKDSQRSSRSRVASLAIECLLQIGPSSKHAHTKRDRFRQAALPNLVLVFRCSTHERINNTRKEPINT